MSSTPAIKLDLASAATLIAGALGIPERSVRGAIELFTDGKALPFIARYRKEKTGGLDEVQLRAVEDALAQYRALIERKNVVLKTIAGQDRLDAALEQRIRGMTDRRELEDLYLPFRPKRKTRASTARERGLEPLARLMLQQTTGQGRREPIVARFVAPGRSVPDAAAAIAGASDILAEEWAEQASYRSWVRGEVGRGKVASKKKRGASDDDGRFTMYHDFSEPIGRLALHRYLAIRRGVAEGVLRVGVDVARERLTGTMQKRVLRKPNLLFRRELEATVADSVSRLLLPSIESEVLAGIGKRADEEAIAVFARNMCDLLLAAPAGARVVLGIDPGFRTGCKVTVVDGTGRLLEKTTIFPTAPREDVAGATTALTRLIERHAVELVAVGNGTASRETTAFVDRVIADSEGSVERIVVSEAGASVYSASELAGEELSELDVSERGAVSIARRLQDPLAELVKIEPRSIGVGQYQHDVDQPALGRALERVVASCVNQVGVDLNTASAALLTHVAGIGPKLARAIVKHRDTNGPFAARKELLAVPRFGATAFEQSAGFLRIRDGEQPLDASAVHPERYGVVDAMARSLGTTSASLIGDREKLGRIEPGRFVDAEVGLPTIEDILAELEKPGRDPRSAFKVARFTEGVNSIGDLTTGMELEGVVTNVTQFGAFVDIGVHQDGLVHISQLADRYVRDPAEVVSVGDVVRVRVMEVDEKRRRIGLSRKGVG